MRLMRTPELSRDLRRSVVVLWLAGASIAGGVAPLAATRQGPGSAIVYASVAVGLIVLAARVADDARWALRVSVVLLALQLFGVIGSAWELVHGVAGGKAAQLRRLGVDPTVGVTLNLAYSAIAFTLFLWAWRCTSRRALPTRR